MILSARDQQSITARVAALEKALGVEVVTLVTAKSDNYPEAVWKAFALGASLTALAVVVAEVLRPDWVSAGAVLSAVLAILGVGATCALAAVYVPAFARLFLRESRAGARGGAVRAGAVPRAELWPAPGSAPRSCCSRVSSSGAW